MLHDVARCTYCAFLWEKQILLVALARIVADSWPWFGDISDIRHCLPTCLPKGSLKRFLDRVEMATWIPLGYGLVTWPHPRILVQSTSLITSSIRRKGDHQMVPCRLASEPSSHHHIITSSHHHHLSRCRRTCLNYTSPNTHDMPKNTSKHVFSLRTLNHAHTRRLVWSVPSQTACSDIHREGLLKEREAWQNLLWSARVHQWQAKWSLEALAFGIWHLMHLGCGMLWDLEFKLWCERSRFSASVRRPHPCDHWPYERRWGQFSAAVFPKHVLLRVLFHFRLHA